MERALYIRMFNELDKQTEYERIYFGSEFCFHKFPSISLIEQTYNYCINNSLGFSLLTPIIPQLHLGEMSLLLEQMNCKEMKCEVVFNDWGVLNILKGFKNFIPVLGRILMKEHKDPRLVTIWSKLPKSVQETWRKPTYTVQNLKPILKSIEVKRVEIDLLLQGIDDSTNEGINVSLYMPYSFLSLTRNCPISPANDRRIDQIRIPLSCNKQCERYGILLKTEEDYFRRNLYMFGNAIFYREEPQLEYLKFRNINRLIFQQSYPQ